MAITTTSPCSKAHQKSGSFPPPALPGFNGRIIRARAEAHRQPAADALATHFTKNRRVPSIRPNTAAKSNTDRCSREEDDSPVPSRYFYGSGSDRDAESHFHPRARPADESERLRPVGFRLKAIASQNSEGCLGAPARRVSASVEAQCTGLMD